MWIKQQIATLFFEVTLLSQVVEESIPNELQQQVSRQRSHAISLPRCNAHSTGSPAKLALLSVRLLKVRIEIVDVRRSLVRHHEATDDAVVSDQFEVQGGCYADDRDEE